MTWTPKTIAAMLRETGLPVSCGPFDRPPAPPFVLWDAGQEDFHADNTNYASVASVLAELYARTRDFPLEKRLETLFRERDLCWKKSTDTMEKERLHVTSYEMEVLFHYADEP